MRFTRHSFRFEKKESCPVRRFHRPMTLSMAVDSIKPGDRVVLIDDLIATGGTIEASIKMIEALGGKVVKIVFLMELAGLKGRERLKGYDVDSVIVYEGK